MIQFFPQRHLNVNPHSFSILVLYLSLLTVMTDVREEMSFFSMTLIQAFKKKKHNVNMLFLMKVVSRVSVKFQ